MSSSSLNPEYLQSAVLSALASSPDGTIEDTRELSTAEGGKLGPGDAQNVVRGVLDSLWSREVITRRSLSSSAGQGKADTESQMITFTQNTTTSFILTDEGLDIAARGSHEYRVWEALPPKGGVALSVAELKVGCSTDSGHLELINYIFTGSRLAHTSQKVVGDETAKIGQMRAFKNKWIAKDGAGFVRAVSFGVPYLWFRTVLGS